MTGLSSINAGNTSVSNILGFKSESSKQKSEKKPFYTSKDVVIDSVVGGAIGSIGEIVLQKARNVPKLDWKYIGLMTAGCAVTQVLLNFGLKYFSNKNSK